MNAHSRTALSSTVFDERLGDTWRHNLCAVRDDLLMINQHRKTLVEADEMLTPTVRLHRAETVEKARKLLPWRLSLYLEHVKAVSLAEAKMDAIGMEYAASSDAWGA